MKKITAWITVFCIVGVTALSGVTMTDAYTITEKAGMRTADKLSEAAAKALDEVSVTDKGMLDDVIKRSYENDFQDKTYIIKNKGENLDKSYWRQYVRSQGDFSVSLDWNVENCAAIVGDNYYYTIRMSSGVTMSPFNYATSTIDRWDEYMDVIRNVENRIGILNDDLCDYQKIQLAYAWIKQNVKYGYASDVSGQHVSGGQEPIEAIL